MKHLCHAHGCERKVPARMFACREHWFALPKKIRDAIWREYNEGQEISKDPTLRYLAVQRLAVMYTAFKPNDETAAQICAQYLQEALVLAKACVEQNLGDPLVGLLPAAAPAPRSP